MIVRERPLERLQLTSGECGRVWSGELIARHPTRAGVTTTSDDPGSRRMAAEQAGRQDAALSDSGLSEGR